MGKWALLAQAAWLSLLLYPATDTPTNSGFTKSKAPACSPFRWKQEHSPNAHITSQMLSFHPSMGTLTILTRRPQNMPLEQISFESSRTSKDTSSPSPTPTTIIRGRPEKWRRLKGKSIGEPSEEPRIPFHLLGVANEPRALRLPLLVGARLSARSPGTRVTAARGRACSPPPARTVAHWSLSSTLPTLAFPLLCGSLGGIFGLEGGEPDGSCLGVEHALPGRGRKGNGEWEGGEELAGRIRGLGEGGARLSLESWLGNLLKAGFTRGSISPPAPARGFEPRGQRMKPCFVFSRDRCNISFPNFVHDLFFRWVRTPVNQVARLKWMIDGILNYSLGPRRFFFNDIQGGKAVFKTRLSFVPTSIALAPHSFSHFSCQSHPTCASPHVQRTFLRLSQSDRCLKVPN